VLLYEIYDIQRFESVGRFVSYCRLVKCAHESQCFVDPSMIAHCLGQRICDSI